MQPSLSNAQQYGMMGNQSVNGMAYNQGGYNGLPNQGGYGNSGMPNNQNINSALYNQLGNGLNLPNNSLNSYFNYNEAMFDVDYSIE